MPTTASAETLNQTLVRLDNTLNRLDQRLELQIDLLKRDFARLETQVDSRASQASVDDVLERVRSIDDKLERIAKDAA